MNDYIYKYNTPASQSENETTKKLITSNSREAGNGILIGIVKK